MPLPFRKKKKKDLPEPPSLSKQDEPFFPEPPKEPRPPPIKEPSIFKGPPREPVTPPIKGPPIYEGPPREPTAPPTKGPPIYEGPPRQSPPRDVTSPPGLPPAPPFTGTIPSQPPLSSQSSKTPTTPFDDALASEIHAELRRKDFGSTMKKVPERKPTKISTQDLAMRRFQDSRKEYIDAGNKHLEMNFYDNAATNYACAILCDLIMEGHSKARRTMKNLSSGAPSALIENTFFDGVRMLIEALRTKNYNFLMRAERSLQSSKEHLYPEDIALIEKAIKTAKAQFGYG